MRRGFPLAVPKALPLRTLNDHSDRLEECEQVCTTARKRRAEALPRLEIGLWLARALEDAISSVEAEQFTRILSFPSRFGQRHTQIRKSALPGGSGLGGLVARVQAAVLRVYDFSRVGTLCDIGGGDGTFLAFLLQAHESLRGMLFERPQLIEQARRRLAEEGVLARCQTVAGDFFTFVPHGGDTYILKWTLCEHDDERALTILKNCRRAMLPHATLLIMEAVASTSRVHAAGRERTEGEFSVLVRKAGLMLNRVIPACKEASVIEVVRV